jgi:hypothetical protein
MTYLEINLTKEVKDLCNENYKPSKKEIQEDYRRWKDLMLTDWQNQYCENGYTTKSNLHFSMQFPSKFP